MNCPKCGSVVEAGARFCSECGAEVPVMEQYTEPVRQNNGSAYAPAGQYVQNVPQHENYTPSPMSTGGWVGRQILLGLLGAIPLVGWIIWLIMLFVWRGDINKDQSFRNWATAQLIFALIGICIVVALIVILLATGGLAYLINMGSSRPYYY